MKKIIPVILVASGVFLLSPLYADECMEGDCDNGAGTGCTENNMTTDIAEKKRGYDG